MADAVNIPFKADLTQVEAALNALPKKAAAVGGPAGLEMLTLHQQALENQRSLLQSRQVEAIRKELSGEARQERITGIAGRTSQVAGIAGRFGSSSMTSEELGGLVGMIGGPVAGSVAGAAAEALQVPFKLLATAAQNAASALQALNSPIGVVAEGLEKESQTLRKIPLIGDSLAKVNDAQRQMYETQTQFAGLYSPQLVTRLKIAVENFQAQVGKGAVAQTENMIRSQELSQKMLATIQEGKGQVTEISGGGIAGIADWLMNDPNSANKAIAQNAKIRQLLARAKGPLTPQAENEIATEFLQIMGRKEFAPTVRAARPAAMSDIMEYERQLQIAAFSQGTDPASKTAEAAGSMLDILKNMWDAWEKVPADNALRKVMENAFGAVFPGLRR